MTLTFHWWAFPTAVTVAFLIWAVWPKETSGMWGGIETMFGFIFWLVAVSVSWAIAGVFFK